MSKIKVRRFKKKIANNKKKIVFVASFLLLFFIGSSYALLKTTQRISGTAGIILPEDETCKLDISSKIEKGNSWASGGYNYFVYNITVTNNSDDDITGWQFDLLANNDIELNYGPAVAVKNADNSLTLTNNDWNGTIEAHSKKSFEFCFQTVEADISIKNFTLNNCSLMNQDSGDHGNVDIPLESITLVPSSYTMTVGEVITLQLEKNPIDAYGEFQWSSNNTRIATVNSRGIVEAKKKGNAIITVTSSTGLVTTSNITVVPGQNEPDVPEEPTGLEFAFKNLYSTQNTLQFEITIKNVTDQTLHHFAFDLDVPEGTTYTFWTNPGVTAIGNTFDVNLLWGDLAPNAETKISGVITLPRGNQGAKYRDMDFKNISY